MIELNIDLGYWVLEISGYSNKRRCRIVGFETDHKGQNQPLVSETSQCADKLAKKRSKL